MQFSINKTAFIQALSITKRAISFKNAIPVLSTIKLEATTDNLLLTGSNGQISIETTLSIHDKDAGLFISNTGSVLLEASFFINVVSSLPETTLEINVIDHYQVVITSGKSEITLKGKSVENYPHIQKMSTDTPLVIETKVLKSIISETAFAASAQESRPLLTGVHMQLQNDHVLKTVATDSHRLSQRLAVLSNKNDVFDVVIPSRSLREFPNIFSEDTAEIELFFSPSQVLFKSKSISFYTRLLEGTYPDTDRLLPNSFETTIIVNRHHLIQAMERANLLSNATQNGTVKLEIANNHVISHVNSPEIGKVHEELDILSLEGEDLTISFNPSYLIDALKVIKDETIALNFISPVRPFTVTPTTDHENFVQLITPIRTN